jgi:hypothetical protein
MCIGLSVEAKEDDPAQQHGQEQEPRGDDAGRLFADQPPAEAADDRADERGEKEDRFHLPQPFITLTSSTAIVPRLRKKQTRMARPMAASAAATVRMNSVKT